MRHIEEMVQEQSVFVGHATVPCWAMKFLLILALAFRISKRAVGTSWKMDKTYIEDAV